MDSEDFFTAANVRTAHDNPAIKTPGSQKRRIEHVGPVCRRHQDDAFIRFETVHLDQQLIQRLLALIMSATEASATMTPNRVDFIDKDDAGSILLSLLEQVADAACSDADEHLYEVRTRNREERHVGFAGNCTSQQGLASSGRANEQDALWNASAKLLELLRLPQEFDNLPQLFFCFIHARHILERDFFLLHGEQAGAALAEGKCFVSTSLHLADHEEP